MFPLTVFFLYLIALCDLTVASPEVTAENTVTVDLWLPAVQSLPVGAYAATELGVVSRYTFLKKYSVLVVDAHTSY